jgi:hypothetical protein
MDALNTEYQGGALDDDARSLDSDMTEIPDSNDEEADARAPADAYSNAFCVIRNWIFQHHRDGDLIDVCNAAAEYALLSYCSSIEGHPRNPSK